MAQRLDACKEESAMPTGIVKWFNDAKGFGFIEPEGGGEDVFAHFSAIQMDGFRTLKQGGRVNYELVKGPKGDMAQSIRESNGAVPSEQANGETTSHSHR
jgi:CspA family cold shock protein